MRVDKATRAMPLRDVGAVTLDGGGAQRCPDETLGDVGIDGVEGAQVVTGYSEA